MYWGLNGDWTNYDKLIYIYIIIIVNQVRWSEIAGGYGMIWILPAQNMLFEKLSSRPW